MSTKYKVYKYKQKIIINNTYTFLSDYHLFKYMPEIIAIITSGNINDTATDVEEQEIKTTLKTYSDKEKIEEILSHMLGIKTINHKKEKYYQLDSFWYYSSSCFMGIKGTEIKADNITSLIVINEYTEVNNEPISYYKDNLSAEDFLHYCHDIYKSFDKTITEV